MEVRKTMTKEEAKANQDRIAKGYDLGYWYGTNCEKCCGVFPKFRTFGDLGGWTRCYYECEVCGKRTDKFEMPHQAEKAWNDHEYISNQLRWF